MTAIDTPVKDTDQFCNKYNIMMHHKIDNSFQQVITYDMPLTRHINYCIVIYFSYYHLHWSNISRSGACVALISMCDKNTQVIVPINCYVTSICGLISSCQYSILLVIQRRNRHLTQFSGCGEVNLLVNCLLLRE